MNIQQLRERYAEPEIPKCRVCGGELTIQRAGGGPTIWGCTGMIDDPTGERNWVYAEGRECADEHYEQSRWSDYRQGGDADVIELIDALEAAERERDEMNGALKASSDNAVTWMKRALKAEMEIERRDAAAGDPDGYIFCHPSGKNFWSVSHPENAGHNGVKPFYFAAPAVRGNEHE